MDDGNGSAVYHENNDQHETEEISEESDEENENDVSRLSDSVFIYQNRKIGDHGNVFEGEIRSGVYGIRVCAIKFARKSEQNLLEAKILSKLGSHTHVVSMIQSGIHKDMLEERVYIALDKCHKQNLRHHLVDTKKEFNLNEALEYSKQIIAGVTYVHENLIIHKDLKPSNILLSHDKSTIKVADFGLSQEIKSTSSKVYCRHQFGTNGFRPTESFGNNWVSLKSDIFSLGVVLYFVLSNGKSPFGDEIALWIQNTRKGIVDLSKMSVPNAKAFQHLLKLMLSEERCRRPSIWQVADHPCWIGKDAECRFDYGDAEEVDDSNIKIPEPLRQDPSDADEDVQSTHQLLLALKEMEFASPKIENSIIIFDKMSKRLHRWNPKNHSMTPMHGFNDEMSKLEFSSVFLNDHIYTLTGKSLYRLKSNDPKATWERMNDLVDAQGSESSHGLVPPAVSASGAIYVIGGGAGIQTVSKYDPSQNRWKRLEDKNLATNGSAIVAAKGNIYSIGGLDSEIFDVTNRVERLNIASKTWEEVAPMFEAKWMTTAVEYRGKVIVAGGYDVSGWHVSSIEQYDPDVNQWTTRKHMTGGRWLFRLHSFEGNMYAIIGGDVGDKTVDNGGDRTIDKYNPLSDQWETVDRFNPEINICESVTARLKR